MARLQDEKRLLDQMLLDDDTTSRSSRGSRDNYRFHDANNGYHDDHDEEIFRGGGGDGRRALARAQRAISILSDQKQVSEDVLIHHISHLNPSPHHIHHPILSPLHTHAINVPSNIFVQRLYLHIFLTATTYGQ